MKEDQNVKFKQAELLPSPILELFVDVPAGFSTYNYSTKRTRREWRLLLEIAREAADTDPGLSAVLLRRLSVEYDEFRSLSGIAVGAARLLLDERIQDELPLVVVEGAPGQGKSTLAQYICQVHRMRFLGDVENLQLVPKDRRIGPVRLPIRLHLRDFATWLRRSNPFAAKDDSELLDWNPSLEAMIAASIAYHSGGVSFEVADLHGVLSGCPVVLVLDGLDEVADITERQHVVDGIVETVSRLQDIATSLQVVVTSRPTAFPNAPTLPNDTFTYLSLTDLPRPLILAYADRWAEARRLDEASAVELVTTLEEKLDQPHMADLARNTMQLSILLSLIHLRGPSLPDKRTELYDTYIDVFFNREAEKSDVVRRHREVLSNFHRFLAWTLHSQAETGHPSGRIRREDLEILLRDYLSRQGHGTELVDELMLGVVERVVALVPRVLGTFEFEVQPLREYFAGRHLYNTAPYSPPGRPRNGTKPDRFSALARNPYWQNVTRFYAGCYSIGELADLADQLEELIAAAEMQSALYPRELIFMLRSR